MSTQQALTQFITEEIMKGRSNQVNPQDDLLTNGVLDSLGILQLVAFIEEKLHVRVPDEDVVYENFHSIEALTAFLSTQQARQ